jgi:peptide/nickel transport system permease protein
MMRETGIGTVAMGGPARVSPRCGARGFAENRPAVYSLMLIALLVAATLLAPVMTPHGRDAMDLQSILAPPSAQHPLGTDELGRDVLARLLYAGRFSMLVAFCSVAIALAIGVLMGTIAGYFGRSADAAVTIAVDLFLSVPVFLVLLVVASAAGGRLWIIPLVIGGTSWMETSRVVRSLVLSLRDEGFVEAARAAGAKETSIIARHVLPQTLPSLVVSATVGFAQAMLVESALSFLGFGVQPPVPTWGNMLQNAAVFIREAPVAAFAPGFMIFVICLSFNQIGEGLRAMLAIDR